MSICACGIEIIEVYRWKQNTTHSRGDEVKRACRVTNSEEATVITARHHFHSPICKRNILGKDQSAVNLQWSEAVDLFLSLYNTLLDYLHRENLSGRNSPKVYVWKHFSIKKKKGP